MSDCTLSYKEVKTRKQHRCECCDRRIRKGAKAIRWSGIYDGNFYCGYAHGVCAHKHVTCVEDWELLDPWEFRTEILGLPLLKARQV
jgi:hypothetical protein